MITIMGLWPDAGPIEPPYALIRKRNLMGSWANKFWIWASIFAYRLSTN
jgi:hypothetical protein